MVDPQLDSRAAQLESEIRNQNSTVRSILENLKRLENSQVPSVVNQLQTARSAIERFLSTDLPNSLRPHEEESIRIRKKFDKFTSETNSRLQLINEKVNELSANIRSLQDKQTSLSNSTKSVVADIENEVSKSKSTLDRSQSRLQTVESNLVRVDQMLQQLKLDLTAMSKSFQDKLAQFNTDSQATIAASQGQLQAALKSETTNRSNSFNVLQKQISDLYQNSSDASQKMIDFLYQMKNQYQTALTSLSKAAKEGLVAVNADATENFSNMQHRLQTFVTDSNQQFSILEGDVTSTINALKNHIVSSHNALEKALAQITESRIQGEAKIAEKYDRLKATITAALTEQTNQVESQAIEAVNVIQHHCQIMATQIHERLTNISSQAEKIVRLQTRVSNLQNALKKSQTTMSEQVQSVTARYTNLRTQIEQAKKKFDMRIEEIDKKLTDLEEQDDVPNLAKKGEMDEMIASTNSLFDARLNELDKQLDFILQNVNELKAPPKQHPKKDPTLSLLDQALLEAEEDDLEE